LPSSPETQMKQFLWNTWWESTVNWTLAC